MLKRKQHPQHRAAKRCDVCGGKFGLIRYHSWRTAICSKKCVHCFKLRTESDRKWLHQCALVESFS
jgi:hypothetical protein